MDGLNLKNRPMLTTEAIMAQAGLTVFKRGLIYAKQGAVGPLTLSPERVQARVLGTQPYQVSLSLDSDVHDIHCTCPAAEYQPLCKHGVALAITYLEQYPSGITLPTESVEPDESDLAQWLETWDKPDLVAELLQFISADPQGWERWQLRYTMAHQTVSLSDMEKMVCQALPFEEIYGYDEVSEYFDHAIGLFRIIFDKLEALPAEQSFTLLQLAYTRLNEVIEEGIYDKGGDAASLDAILAPQLRETFERLPWTDEEKARFILQQQGSDWHYYLDLPAALLVNSGVELAYLQLCQAQWDALPPLAENADWQDKRHYRQLAHRLLHQAEERGDLAQQIALQAKMATDWRDYLCLCRLTMRYEALDQARLWMEKAKASVSRDTERLQVLECDVALALQRQEPERAWQQQWEHFQLGKRFEHYQQLVSLAQTLGYQEQDYQHQAEAMLLHEAKKGHRRRRPASYGVEDVNNTVLAFYRYHQQWEKALAWAERFACSLVERRLLANAVVEQYPEAAFALYRQILAETVDLTNNSAYQQAVDWILELQAALECIDDNQASVMVKSLVMYLRQEKKAKRNLMALLNTHFPNRP